MKKFVLPLCVILFVMLVSGPTAAQNRKGAVSINTGQTLGDEPMQFEFPVLEQRPPLTSDMPYDIMQAYILADSLARSMTGDRLIRVFSTLTDSDTLRYAAKYLYKMNDYDPIRFYQWNAKHQGLIYASEPGWIKARLLEAAQYRTENGKQLRALLSADIIAHVKAKTISEHTTSAGWANEEHLVACEIIEPIKGKEIPSCVGTGNAEQPDYSQPAVSGACMQFTYSVKWPRVKGALGGANLDSTLAVSAVSPGGPWIQPDEEYIVFLDFWNVTEDPRDSTFFDKNLAYLSPGLLVHLTTTAGMYPISDGKVWDPYNDFDLGYDLTVSEWIGGLRSKIDEIVSYRE